MIASLLVFQVLPYALAAASAATPLYIVCLIVGGGLLVVSTVLGGHGHDADVGGADIDAGGLEGAGDVDASADFDTGADHLDGAEVGPAGHGADLLSISTWFSIRFLVYFAAAFGSIGTILSYLTDSSPGVVLGLALGGGLLVGQGVHQAMRALQRSSGGGDARVKDFIDRPARVTIAVRPPARGEVGVTVGNKEFFLPAVAQRSDDSFRTGDLVVIAKYAGGTAEIVSREEHAFLKES